MEIVNRAIAQRLKEVRMVGNGINEIIHIDEALHIAEDRGLDLVLVSEEVTPPVVRIQDFKKIEYNKKKARKASKQTNLPLKEIYFKVNISDHDLSTKVSKIDNFLKRGNKVKISVRLKGRENDSPERAVDLIKRVVSLVECQYNIIPGPMAIAILEPVSTTNKKTPTKPAK